jgi:hypothetical protein
MFLPRTLALLSAFALVGCGGAASLRSSRSQPLVERSVTRESFADVRREFLVLAPEDPDRRVVQARLFAYLAEGADARIAAGDYEEVVARLAEMTELLAPIDLADGVRLPEPFGRLAHFVAERGAPRGDEARVLGALFLLSRIEPEDGAHAAEYERAAVWGHDARFGGPGEVRSLFDRLDGGQSLVAVWEAHARLSPAPEVLDRLARLHVELRDGLGGRGERGFAPPRSMAELEALSYVNAVIERTPLEVAATYLRVGDLALAGERVAALVDDRGAAWRVQRLIEAAAQDDEPGAEALLQLALGFGEVRPDVSVAVCRNGHRRFPGRADFPLCLARFGDDSPADTAAWYVEAVERSPDEREVYDEALGETPALLARALEAEADIGSIRALLADTEWILGERNRRWPDEPAQLTLATLRLGLADAEASAGNVTEARTALEESLALERSSGALRELATLELHTGHPERAALVLREALDALTDQGPAGRLLRATLLSQLADAQRLGAEAEESLRTYRQAFDLYRTLAEEPGTEGPGLAFLQARLGAVARRLGDHAASDAAFRAAMRTLPDGASPFADTLATLVVAAPDGELAAEAFHGARVGSALEPQWKVYFALWAQIAAERAGAPVDPELLDVLAEHAELEGWHGRLAALGAGRATAAEVLAAATSPGERCEAHFYAGARQLAAGDRAGAEASFRAALATGMVRFWEYRMALELLAAP